MIDEFVRSIAGGVALGDTVGRGRSPVNEDRPGKVGRLDRGNLAVGVSLPKPDSEPQLDHAARTGPSVLREQVEKDPRMDRRLRALWRSSRFLPQ